MHLIKDGPDSFKWKIIGIISMGKHCHTGRGFKIGRAHV